MKYLVLIYGNKELWESFTPRPVRAGDRRPGSVDRQVPATGELLGAYGLSDGTGAKAVRVRRAARLI